MISAMAFFAAHQPLAWEGVFDIVGAAIMAIGVSYTLIAAIGLLRFRDLFARMHAATKPQMLGLMLICLGITLSMRTWVWFFVCTLVVAIQMITAPIGSHMLGRTGYRTGLAESEGLVVNDLAADEQDREKTTESGEQPK